MGLVDLWATIFQYQSRLSKLQMFDFIPCCFIPEGDWAQKRASAETIKFFYLLTKQSIYFFARERGKVDFHKRTNTTNWA